MANRSSATSGNWRADDADTWGLGIGNYPAAGDLVTILNGHDVTLVEDNVAGAVVINSGGTITGGGNKLTLDDNAGTTFIFSSVGSGVSGKSAIEGVLDIDITGGSADRPINEVGTGSIRHLTINNAQTYNLHANLSLDGNLNITQGTLNTQNSGGVDNSLTVPGSISGNGTLTANASTVTVTGQTTVNTLNITSGTYNYFDDFKPTTCNITDNATFNQTSIGGKFGGRIIITASKTPTFNAVGRLDSTFDIQSGEQGNSTFNLDLSETQDGPPRALFFHNLELDSQNTENNTFTMAGAITCTGNLTITDGTIDTSSSDHALTVTRDLLLPSGGALTGNSSTLTFGHITLNGGTLSAPDSSGSLVVTGPVNAGWLFNKTSGTFNHNDGLVHILAGTNSGHLRIDPYDLKIEMHGSNRVLWRDVSGNEMTVARDLRIVQGGFDRNDLTDALTVGRDVLIEDGGKIGDQNGSGVETGDNTFGSLTINSGGIYDATSGTTTITGEGDGSSGTNGFAWYNDNATFTHNKGKVVIDTAGNNHTLVAENTFYDLEINQTSSVYEMKLRPSNNGGTANKILNNFTLTSGIFEKNNASDTLDIFGLTNISANGKFMEDANENTNTITHHGLVTNSGTYKINDGTTVKMNGGIRNLGTITVA